MKPFLETALRGLHPLPRVLAGVTLAALCGAAAPGSAPAPAPSADPAHPTAADAELTHAAWVARAADEARAITARGPGLTAALSDKGRLLAAAAGLGAASGNAPAAERWFALAQLCERALTHRQANGPVTAALVEALVRAGRVDDATGRVDALSPGADRESARAALAGALAVAAPDDPRAARLRAQAPPAAAAAWAPAFIEAGDFDGLSRLLADADLTDARRAGLLARLAEAQAQSGDAQTAARTLDRARALAGPDAGQGPALARARALAALGRLDAAAAAVNALQDPAARVRGLVRLAAASPPGTDGGLLTAAGLVAQWPAAQGMPGSARELARVAADRGRAAETAQWVQTLGPPRVRAAAALGLAEGLSPPAQRPRMLRPPARAAPHTRDALAGLAPRAPGAIEPPHPLPAGHAAATPAAPGPWGDDAGAELDRATQELIRRTLAELPGWPAAAAVAGGPDPSPSPAAAHPHPAATPEAEPPRAALTPTPRKTPASPAAAHDPPQAHAPAKAPVAGREPAADTPPTPVRPDAPPHAAGSTAGSANGSADAAPAARPIAAVPDLRRLANPQDPQFSTPAPESYEARFVTTRGSFTLRVHRAWAPLASDRFYQLCRAGFYNNNRFFRVVPGFVAQWGIHGFPSVATSWRNVTIADEPVRERNRRGTVSFAAASTPGTRTTQVFINLADNHFLDDLGFAPFAEVVRGMDVADRLFSGYGETPSQEQRRIQLDGNAFLDEHYPDLDGVVEVEISSPTD